MVSIKKTSGVILVVDDEDPSITRIKSILNKDGYDIHIDRNGLEGLQKAKKIKPDLILMDISMPGMDGYEATSLIKKCPALKEMLNIAGVFKSMKSMNLWHRRGRKNLPAFVFKLKT